MTRTIVSILMLATLAQGTAAAQAPYPNRPIRLIVPFAAGGSADVAARGVTTALGERWGQQIVIENKADANTQIGAELVAKAEPDGYTLLWGSEATFVINPLLLRGKLRYDPVKDFVPITGTVAINQALVVHPSVPARTIAEFVALAKAKPKTLNYGTVGFGSAAHLNTEQMDQLSGFHTVEVHYKGSGPALADVIAGHIQFALVSVWLARDPSQTGLVRALAVGSPVRSREFPDLPTMDEAGLTGYDGSS
jgi:tripartite-type tricarboxylate transporter receptor subunit TctC